MYAAAEIELKCSCSCGADCTATAAAGAWVDYHARVAVTACHAAAIPAQLRRRGQRVQVLQSPPVQVLQSPPVHVLRESRASTRDLPPVQHSQTISLLGVTWSQPITAAAPLDDASASAQGYHVAVEL